MVLSQALWRKRQGLISNHIQMILMNQMVDLKLICKEAASWIVRRLQKSQILQILKCKIQMIRMMRIISMSRMRRKMLLIFWLRRKRRSNSRSSISRRSRKGSFSRRSRENSSNKDTRTRKKRINCWHLTYPTIAVLKAISKTRERLQW